MVPVARGNRAVDGPIFLFGGSEFEDFLGCLNCFRTEPFSVWNESAEYGDPTNPISIWNTSGVYGALDSDESPWNPHAKSPPVAVDRVGNLYGYFTRNANIPQRVRPSPGHPYWSHFDLLVSLLENYDWVIAHLEEMRAEYDGRPWVDPDRPDVPGNDE